MRPTPALEGTSRPRNPSTDTVAPSSGPVSFFLASESELNQRPSNPSLRQDSSPIRTLKPSTSNDEVRPTKASPPRVTAQVHPRRDGSRRRSTIRPKSIEELRNEAIRQQAATHSRPVAGISTPTIPSSQEPSLPGSPKSFSSRSLPRSDGDSPLDDSGSQVIDSEEDEDDDNVTSSVQDSAPQLIMPSIRMPSRRPFTERGKQLGKFKIMVIGNKGTGKTSLIKSIVQLCEDIVHVDPVVPTTSPRLALHNKRTAYAFQETYASTKPYPEWWSDMEESRVLKRRKSMGDSVLERNICFVDSTHSTSPAFAAAYIEQQLSKVIHCTNQATAELTGLLSGSGGSQVDLVLYLISPDTIREDEEQIRKLSRLANVVPLVSKSDLCTAEQLDTIKATASVDTCLIPRLPISHGTSTSPSTATSPYFVSCVNGPDYDNMDASLLMASEYIQPLLPSELALLIDEIFDPENMQYIRHLAAKKLISWYNSGDALTDSIRSTSPASARVRSPVPSTLNSPQLASLSASGVLVPVTSHSELSLNTSNSFALAKVADHTHKEERLAHIRLSKWASDLQLSLQREREKYEEIARKERAMWLVERMGEEIRDGQLIPVTNTEVDEAERGNVKVRPRRKIYHDGPMSYQIHDPLGLLRWQDTVRAQTWLALQVVGSFGVVGGLALFLTKAWGYETSFHQWARDWGLWHD